MSKERNLTTPMLLRTFGPLACFTRAEFKTERMSYPVMTPSAARGVLEAVLWKPQMRWRVERIKVLAPIVFTSFRRNEVASVAAIPTRSVVETGGEYGALLVEDRRQQRNTVALRDVDYVIEARMELTDRAGVDDSLTKYVDMFQRRLERGQRFAQPYMGCRECAADVEPVDGTTPNPVEESRDLGLMLWDIQFIPGKPPKGSRSISWRDGGGLVSGFTRPVFFAAKLERGVMEVPPDAAAAEATLGNRKSPRKRDKG